MDTLTDNDIRICPRCNSSTKPLEGSCAVCGAIPEFDSELLVPAKKTSPRLMKFAMYLLSAVAFSLGILEGFFNNNSATMAVDLVVSLVLLSLTPRAHDNPVSTMAICIVVAFIVPLLLPRLDLLPMQGWMAIRLFLLFIPLAALVTYATRKRL